MHCDAVRSGALRKQRKRNRIRLHRAARGASDISIPGLSQRSAVVDVYTEEYHGTATNDINLHRRKLGKWFAIARRLNPISSVSQPPKQENVLLNLVCNIAVPTVVLMKFSSEKYLGPLWGLVVALAFPIGYGVYDLIARRKTNLLSVIGFISVLLSGGLGLLKAGGIWFAVKDAAVPTVIGAAVLLSVRSKKPLVRELLFNDQIIEVERVTAALESRGQRPAFDRLLRNASVWVAIAFLGSAVVNFALARYILTSPPATPEFNKELGKMHFLVWPVIVLPSMVVMMLVFWKLVTGLTALTGLTSDEIFRGEKPKEEKKPIEK